MGNGKLTNRELFLKLLDIVDKNHQSQRDLAHALDSLATKQGELNELIKGKVWWLIAVLLAALLGTIGINIPGVLG